jgi:maltose/moltooligosaccharide transporter
MLDIQKRLTNSFYAIMSMPATAMGFALCVQIAALSWILNTKYGFDPHEVGIVWAAGPLAGIIGQVLIGLISDNVWFWKGRRRPFIIIGSFLAALMILALPYIDVIHSAMGIGSLVGVAITVALTLDLAINISFNPTRTLISDLTPIGEKRTKGYTIMQTVSGFFGVIAYLIGAFISNYFLIYFGGAFVLLAGLVPLFFIEEPRELSNKAETSEGEEILVEGKTDTPEFLKICFAHAFTWIGVQTMFIYTFFYIKEVILGYGTTEEVGTDVSDSIGFSIGIAFAILNTIGFLGPTLLLEPLARKIGRVKTHMLCIFSMALGYALLVMLGKTTVAFYVFMVLIGIGWGAVVSLPFAIMSEVVDQNKMGLFMGLFNLSVVIPQLIASGLGGFIQDQPNKNMIFIISAVTLAISGVLWLLVREQKLPEKGAGDDSMILDAGH